MDELNKRIIELMLNLNISKSSFANELQVSLPIITHITTGRNKPGLDIIQKIILKYNQINPDWLLNGNGKMRRVSLESVDYEEIYKELDKIENELIEHEKINNTIRNYHKILVDEINHLKEMNEIIDSSSKKNHAISLQIQKIRANLKSK